MTLEQLWELVGTALKRKLGIETLNESSKQFLWQQLIATGEYYLTLADTHARLDPSRSVTTSLPKDTRIAIPREERLLFYTAGKPVRLTDVQIKALEIIARSQRRGVTQAEAAKQLSLDARSFFHQLKALLEYRLISKMPVSQQRTFTYLLHLTRYAEFEDEILTSVQTTEALQTPLVIPSASSIRGRIMELLQSAPQRTLSASEIYRLVQADAKAIKIYRKHIAWLVTHGHVECFVAEELGGVMGKILRWKRPLNELAAAGAASRKGVEGMGSSSYSEEATGSHHAHHSLGILSTCPVLAKAVALERQVHDYIGASGSDGVTLAQIMADFGLNRKLGYRIGDRLTSGKVWSDSDVIKVAEFYGKERRHRYYTRQGQGQRPRSPRRTITAAEDGHGSPEECNADTIPIVLPSISGTSAARDSINRTRRLQILKELLDELRMVEVGKQLAVELQRRLNEHEFTMDTKTLKRLISLLEQAGDCHTVVVALPTGGSRAILLHRTLSLSDPPVQRYIESVKRSKIELSAGPRTDVKGDGDSTLTDVPMDDSQAAPSPSTGATGKSHKYQMQKHGFIQGIMVRCRLLHRYLIRGTFATGREEWQACETLPWLFRHLPFDLFLKLVGLAEMSPQLTSFMASVRPAEVTMDTLPRTIRQEIHRRRVDAHKRTMKQLMECICQLGLATVDNRYPSVAFRLPYQYRLARHASILDVGTGQLKESLDLIQSNNFDRYWAWLESLSKADRTIDDNADHVEEAGGGAQTIPPDHLEKKVTLPSPLTAETLTAAPSLPPIYQTIVMVRESWQVTSSNRRLLRKALRELIRQQDELGTEHEQILQLGRPSMEIARELVELQTDYEIESLERVQAEYVALLAERTEQRVRRQRTRQQRLRARRQLRPRSEGGTEYPAEEEEGPVSPEPETDDTPLLEVRRSTKASLSETDMQMLRLATVLLHRPGLRSGPGNLQWSLVEALSRPRIRLLPTALGDEVRALVTRLALSYDQQAKPMVELERELAFLEAAIKAEVLDPEPEMTAATSQEDYFVALVQYYANLFTQLSSIKERIRMMSKGRLPSDEMIPVRFSLAQTMQAIPWQRMSRLQQQHYFADLPPYQARTDEQPSQREPEKEFLDSHPLLLVTPISASVIESHPPSWSPYEAEVAILKRTLMVPVPGEYQAELAHAQLRAAEPSRLEAALNLLLSSRLMARGIPAHYVQRPLGGEYSVHERFLEIIDGIERWDPLGENDQPHAEGGGEREEQLLSEAAPSSPQLTEEKKYRSPPSPSLVQRLRAISRGLAKVDLTCADGLETITTDGSHQIRNRLEEVILRFSQNHNLHPAPNPNLSANPRPASASSDSPSPLGDPLPGMMVWDLGPRRSSILRASCKFVYEVIEAIPTGGATLQQLSTVCWPFLTTVEVETVLTILQETGLIESEIGTPFFFLK